MSMRKDRVEKTIQKEVSNIIHDEIKDPRLGFVTITKVEISNDLRDAKISFSVLGNKQDYQRTAEALNSAHKFIRRRIAENIQLRFAPTIIFREDRSAEYSARIEEVLNQIGELNEHKKDNRKHKTK